MTKTNTKGKQEKNDTGEDAHAQDRVTGTGDRDRVTGARDHVTGNAAIEDEKSRVKNFLCSHFVFLLETVLL